MQPMKRSGNVTLRKDTNPHSLSILKNHDAAILAACVCVCVWISLHHSAAIRVGEECGNVREYYDQSSRFPSQQHQQCQQRERCAAMDENGSNRTAQWRDALAEVGPHSLDRGLERVLIWRLRLLGASGSNKRSVCVEDQCEFVMGMGEIEVCADDGASAAMETLGHGCRQ